MNKDLTLPHSGINFDANVVTKRTLNEWLSMASKQYFPEMDDKNREDRLTDIYTQCAKLKADNQPAHEAPQDDAVTLNPPAADTNKAKTKPKATDKGGGDDTKVKD